MAKNTGRKTKRTKSKPSVLKPKKKAAAKTKVKSRTNKASGRKLSGKTKRPAPRKKRSTKSRAKEVRSPEPSTLSGATFSVETPAARGARRSRSAGQSGDIQSLSRTALVDSESVEELLEEGQAREAAAISGVEDAPDPDQGEIRTRETLEDDVPQEYIDED